MQVKLKNTVKCLYCYLLLVFLPQHCFSQDYVRYMTGDTSDVTREVKPAFVLAGGGPDNDLAMKWMLNRASGGDVLVLRASGSDGYNPYFYSELGVTVNSVETIVFRNRNASSDPYILRRIAEAELIWFAGGDQGKYYDYWAGTPAGDLMSAIAESRKRVMGGTSAGMMILGGILYAPTGTGVISGEALADPYHFHMQELRYNTFMKTAIFRDVVFDTHFDQRDRAGRTLTFMARAAKDKGIRARAIACNEHTAICIDENNQARVYGDPDSGIDIAYFLEANCEDTWQPLTVEAGKPLTWTTVHQNAVIVQAVAGSDEDKPVFNLNEWKSAPGADLMHWQAKNGTLEKKTSQTSDCRAVPSGTGDVNGHVKLYPNPARDILHFDQVDKAVLSTLTGKYVTECNDCGYLQGLDGLARGLYMLQLTRAGRTEVRKTVMLD